MTELIVRAKKLENGEKIVGTGINFVDGRAYLYDKYAWYEVDPETVVMRAKKDEEHYPNPVTTSNDIAELHERLVQTVVDFCREKKNHEIQEVMFDVDDLQESVEYGEWCPGTDSSLTVYGYDCNKRKEIGTSI